jgi:drug/metabolite transporter (DMT)-like permease
MFWSALILLPWCFHRVIYAFQKDSKMMWVRAIFGSLGAICYFHSLKYTSVSMAVLLWSASPVFVILISVVFLGERLSWRQIFGAITVMIGIFALKFGDYTSISLSVLTVGFAGAFFAACAYCRQQFKSADNLALPALSGLVVFLTNFII